MTGKSREGGLEWGVADLGFACGKEGSAMGRKESGEEWWKANVSKEFV